MHSKSTLRAMTILAGTALAGHVSTAVAQDTPFDPATYFEGKTIEFVITSNPGGGQDTMARVLLTDFADALPGNVRFNATNIPDMPGISAVYAAPSSDDRITIGITTRASTLYLSTEEPGATHDPAKIQLAGGFATTPSWTMIFNEASDTYKSVADASGAKSPEIVFAETVGDATGVIASALYISWLCKTFDMPCRMVNVADANTNTLAQDVRRGDLNLMDANAVTGMRLFSDEFASGEAQVFVEYAEEGSATLETPYPRPNLRDLLPNEQAVKEFDAMLPVIGYAGVANVIFAGPNIPAEAVKMIGDAFVKKLSDPDSLKKIAAGRFGAFTPTVIGPDDAQRIYAANLESYLANKENITAMQKELYEAYWQ
jgi:tripartite-type tricarboxylate transporter receptor subunit TctC